MRKKETICFILVVLNLFSWSVVFELAQDKGLEVCFFNVGQGDAIFIETPWHHQILIDGGPDDTILSKLEQKIPFWDKTIDLIVLTHADADHITGLISVLENYKIENIIWTGLDKNTLVAKKWRGLLEEEGAEIRIAVKGLKAILGGNMQLKVVFPFESLENRAIQDLNDASVVMKMESGGEAVLLTGDISDRVEKALIDSNSDIEARILKIAHHGSKTSTSEGFLEAVKPDVAIISVGRDNRFGHPAEIVLDRLNNFNIKVLRTDKNNNICLIQKKKKPFSLSSPME
jgi:competence protein ComEC